MRKNSQMIYAMMVAMAVVVVALFVFGVVDRAKEPASFEQVSEQSSN